MDDGVVTFETCAVIGSDQDGRRTPEFPDPMEFMVINPSWYVPRSIIVNEYLPALRRNRIAAGHLQVIDGSGRVVGRIAVNTGGDFPYDMRQPAALAALGVDAAPAPA